MQNNWSKKTLELVTAKNYLDQLQVVYPHEDGERNVPERILDSIRSAFGKKDLKQLLNQLLDLEKFPYKDSYVGFLRKDREAIDRNPSTVKRICGRLYDMGIENVISGVTQPKEANMRRGNQFTEWVKENFNLIGIEDFVKSNKGITILGATEKEALDFCNKTLRVGISKRPDIVAKAGSKYVIGEAKFLSSSGGNQGRAFDDGIKLAANADGGAYKVFILDGIHWIETGSDQFSRISHSTANIFSTLLLKEFLEVLTNSNL